MPTLSTSFTCAHCVYRWKDVLAGLPALADQLDGLMRAKCGDTRLADLRSSVKRLQIQHVHIAVLLQQLEVCFVVDNGIILVSSCCTRGCLRTCFVGRGPSRTRMPGMRRGLPLPSAAGTITARTTTIWCSPFSCCWSPRLNSWSQPPHRPCTHARPSPGPLNAP